MDTTKNPLGKKGSKKSAWWSPKSQFFNYFLHHWVCPFWNLIAKWWWAIFDLNLLANVGQKVENQWKCDSNLMEMTKNSTRPTNVQLWLPAKQCSSSKQCDFIINQWRAVGQRWAGHNLWPNADKLPANNGQPAGQSLWLQPATIVEQIRQPPLRRSHQLQGPLLGGSRAGHLGLTSNHSCDMLHGGHSNAISDI